MISEEIVTDRGHESPPKLLDELFFELMSLFYFYERIRMQQTGQRSGFVALSAAPGVVARHLFPCVCFDTL